MMVWLGHLEGSCLNFVSAVTLTWKIDKLVEEGIVDKGRRRVSQLQKVRQALVDNFQTSKPNKSPKQHCFKSPKSPIDKQTNTTTTTPKKPPNFPPIQIDIIPAIIRLI
jgi:hypothetical protein